MLVAAAFTLRLKQFAHHGSRLATPAVGHASCDPALLFNMGDSCVQMGSRMHVGERLQMHVVLVVELAGFQASVQTCVFSCNLRGLFAWFGLVFLWLGLVCP